MKSGVVLASFIDDFINKVGEAMKEIPNKLIPNLFSFVIQLLALIVLIVVVFIFAYKPVKKLLNKRATYIENNILESDNNKEIALQNKKEAEEMLLNSKKEALNIIENAEKEALKKKNDIEEETRKEIIQMKIDAKKDIEISQNEARLAIRREMVEVALTASSEILKREVNSQDNIRLTEEFIDSIE